MSWVQIRPADRRDAAVTLAIRRRRRPGRVEHRAHLRLAAAVLRQAGLAPGEPVALLLGRGEDAGRIALRKAAQAADGFRLARHGRGARLTLAPALLGLAEAVLAPRSLPHQLAGDMLVLTLPDLPDAADPIRPRAGAGGAAQPAPSPGTAAHLDEARAAAAADLPEMSPQGPRGRAWSAAEEAQLRRMRQAGLSTAAIAEALGRTPAAVAIRISLLKLPKADGSAARAAARPVPAQAAGPARQTDDPAAAEALAWLRWEGEAIERLEGGLFCIAGEKVTPLRLVQIANDRRARRAPPLPALPAPEAARDAGAAHRSLRPSG